MSLPKYRPVQEYLRLLRETGKVNMYMDAHRYLERDFSLNEDQAKGIALHYLTNSLNYKSFNLILFPGDVYAPKRDA